MARTHLPLFEEALERYDIEPRQFYKVLEEYAQLAVELVLEEDPQRDPFAFLKLSDQSEVVQAFCKLFFEQSPHLMFKRKGEAADDDEAC